MHWQAAVVTIHDGDTVTVDIDTGCYVHRKPADLGLHLWVAANHLHVHQPLRLAGLNAIELDQPGGPDARDHLAALMPVGSQVTVTTWLDGTDKYGRILGALNYAGTDINQRMVDDGYAAAWNGRGPKPTPPWPIPGA